MISRYPCILVMLIWASCYFTILNATALATETTDGLIGYYKFDGDGMDACGISGTFDLKGTAFAEKTLYLNGEYEFGSNGFRAVAGIPQLTYSAFTISLEFKSIYMGTREGFWTRFFGHYMKTNNIITGGTSCRWFSLRRAENKNLELTLNNQDYSYTFQNAPVRENVWNRMVCCVDLEKALIRTFYNGTKLEDVHLPSDFVLRVKSSDKDENITFTNYSNGDTFYGYADNLRVWNRALHDEEVMILQFEHPIEQGKKAAWFKWGAFILCPIGITLGFYFHRIRRRSKLPLCPLR